MAETSYAPCGDLNLAYQVFGDGPVEVVFVAPTMGSHVELCWTLPEFKAFFERLANAHADAGSNAGGRPVLQIGMDTPQVTDELLASCSRRLLQAQAVLGLACDGGWWVLGLQTPAAAECLRSVPMSQPDTGELTLKALRANGIDVTSVERLTDVDVVDDIAAVRDACDPASRFARVTRAAGL